MEPGSCSAECRHVQFFPLSCSLYNYFLKSRKEEYLMRGFTGEERPEVLLPLAASIPRWQSSGPQPMCTLSLSQREDLP